MKLKMFFSIATLSIITLLCIWLFNKPSKVDIAKLMVNRLIIEELIKHSSQVDSKGQFTSFDFLSDKSGIIVEDGKILDPWGKPYEYGFEERIFRVRNSQASLEEIKRIEDGIR